MTYMINSFLIFFIKLLPKSFVSIFAKQYVAGQNTQDVLNVVRDLNNKGFKTTIDILGEHFVNQNAIDEIISELKITKVSERSGRTMDHEQEDVFEKLRSKGYM